MSSPLGPTRGVTSSLESGCPSVQRFRLGLSYRHTSPGVVSMVPVVRGVHLGVPLPFRLGPPVLVDLVAPRSVVVLACPVYPSTCVFSLWSFSRTVGSDPAEYRTLVATATARGRPPSPPRTVVSRSIACVLSLCPGRVSSLTTSALGTCRYAYLLPDSLCRSASEVQRRFCVCVWCLPL